MNGKRILLGVVSLVVLVGLPLGIYLATRPGGEQDPGSLASGSGNPVSCPSGTTPLFSKVGDINNGDSTAASGKVTSLSGSWEVSSQNGVLLAWHGTDITVEFPENVLMDSMLVYDNDHDAWEINGKKVPNTSNNTWGSLFSINIESNKMVFENNNDSPHFNVCLKQPEPTKTPTPSPSPTSTVIVTPTVTLTPVPSSTPSPSNSPTPTYCPLPKVPTNVRIVCPNCDLAI